MEEMVGIFVRGREGLLTFARDAARIGAEETDGEPRPKKRRKVGGGESARQSERRSTRSQARRDAIQIEQGGALPEVEVRDSEAGSEYEYGRDSQTSNSPEMGETPTVPVDGLVACPICNKRMKNDTVFTHLDHCDGTPGARLSDQQADQPNGICTTALAHVSIASAQSSGRKPTLRLPTLAYSMLNETALRKKLKDLGIPFIGPKLLLQKRHTEWVNLWNANCDSRNPRSKRELLLELDIWERTQGRQILNAQAQGPVGVMAKDFDGEGWVKGNKNDFDDLIRKAREKKSTPTLKPEADLQDRVGEQESRNVSHHFQPPMSGSLASIRNGRHTEVSTPETLVELTPPKTSTFEAEQSQSSHTDGVTA